MNQTAVYLGGALVAGIVAFTTVQYLPDRPTEEVPTPSADQPADEKEQVDREFLALEREKLAVERERIELERLKLQEQIQAGRERLILRIAELEGSGKAGQANEEAVDPKAALAEEVRAAEPIQAEPEEEIAPLQINDPVDTSYAIESVDDFYEPLQPHGTWFSSADYGYAWQPYQAASNLAWRPYSHGCWVDTDCGWTWVADNEPFGWATYHYGRWVCLTGRGWCWVPGREWAPAWVSWRSCDTYVGWAPLPPVVVWNQHHGVGSWVDTVCDIGPGNYNFIELAHFGARNYSSHCLPRPRCASIFLTSVNVTNLHWRAEHGGHHRYHGRGRMVNHGPDREHIRRFCSLPDSPAQLDFRPPRPGERGVDWNRQAATLRLSRLDPELRKKPGNADRSRYEGKLASLKRMPVNRGWDLVSNRAEEVALRRHMLAQPEAKPVSVGRTEVVVSPRDPASGKSAMVARKLNPATPPLVESVRSAIRPQPADVARRTPAKPAVARVDPPKPANIPDREAEARAMRERARELQANQKVEREREARARAIAAVEEEDRRRADLARKNQNAVAKARAAQEGVGRRDEMAKNRQNAEANARANAAAAADEKRRQNAVALKRQQERAAAEANERRKRDEGARRAAQAQELARERQKELARKQERQRQEAEARKRADDVRRKNEELAQRRAQEKAAAAAAEARRQQEARARQMAEAQRRAQADQQRKEADQRQRAAMEAARRQKAAQDQQRRAAEAARAQKAAEQARRAADAARAQRGAEAAKRAAAAQAAKNRPRGGGKRK